MVWRKIGGGWRGYEGGKQVATVTGVGGFWLVEAAGEVSGNFSILADAKDKAEKLVVENRKNADVYVTLASRALGIAESEVSEEQRVEVRKRFHAYANDIGGQFTDASFHTFIDRYAELRGGK